MQEWHRAGLVERLPSSFHLAGAFRKHLDLDGWPRYPSGQFLGGTMKRTLALVFFCLLLSANCRAQQTDSGTPATKEEVLAYFQAVHMRDVMKKLVSAMSEPFHQMMHQRILAMKSQDNLPPDFEERINKRLDELMSGMPIDEMLAAMVPTYQKHLTKEDLDILVAFYSSPTGQKVFLEMPAMTAEGMQSAKPVIEKWSESVKQQMQQEALQILQPQNPTQASADGSSGEPRSIPPANAVGSSSATAGAPSPADSTKVRVGANAMNAKKTNNVLPVYPQIAKTAHVQGTVLLHAIISEDGSVQELQYISGPPLLMRAAMDAVRQWQYSPTLLNGKPVRVETQIQVIFALGG
jgi:TonB family protein